MKVLNVILGMSLCGFLVSACSHKGGSHSDQGGVIEQNTGPSNEPATDDQPGANGEGDNRRIDSNENSRGEEVIPARMVQMLNDDNCDYTVKGSTYQFGRSGMFKVYRDTLATLEVAKGGRAFNVEIFTSATYMDPTHTNEDFSGSEYRSFSAVWRVVGQELELSSNGIVVGYLSAPDSVQQMYLRFVDPDLIAMGMQPKFRAEMNVSNCSQN